MTQEELALIKLESRIFTNKMAMKRTEDLWRDLLRESEKPAIGDDGVVCFGVDLLAEMEKCAKHLTHLQNEIHECEKAIFKHKIRYGDVDVSL